MHIDLTGQRILVTGASCGIGRALARGLGEAGAMVAVHYHRSEKENVKAFVVAPGYVRTEMARQFIEKYGEEFAIGDLALGRMTGPEDLVPLVVLLASGLADHATGGTFDVNAGSYVH